MKPISLNLHKQGNSSSGGMYRRLLLLFREAGRDCCERELVDDLGVTSTIGGTSSNTNRDCFDRVLFEEFTESLVLVLWIGVMREEGFDESFPLEIYM